jgi:ABC-type Fe3+ transport system permease subunit
MDTFWCAFFFMVVSLLCGDGMNIYLVASLFMLATWFNEGSSILILIPASIFAIAGAIAGNGKRQVEFEKKKTSLTVPEK